MKGVEEADPFGLNDEELIKGSLDEGGARYHSLINCPTLPCSGKKRKHSSFNPPTQYTPILLEGENETSELSSESESHYTLKKGGASMRIVSALPPPWTTQVHGFFPPSARVTASSFSAEPTASGFLPPFPVFSSSLVSRGNPPPSMFATLITAAFAEKEEMSAVEPSPRGRQVSTKISFTL